MAAPFHPVKQVGAGWKVIDRQSGKPYSKHVQTKAVANAQLRAIEANKHGGFKGGK